MASTPAGVAVPHASRAPAVGTVVSVQAHEAEVSLAEGGRAILPLDQVCAEPISHVGERLKVGDKVIGLVTHAGNDAVTLSVKEYQRFSIQQKFTPSQQPRTVSRTTNPSSRQLPEDDEGNLSGKAGGKKIPDDLWREIERDHPVGSRLTGKVTNVMSFGAFVEVRPGFNGLVKNSELDWLATKAVASDHVKVGDQVEVTVQWLDQEKRGIYLSIKRCLPNPWQEFKDRHAQGSKFTGTVNSCSIEHGLFVTLPGGLSGMVDKNSTHNGSMHWRELIDDYEVGDPINVGLGDVNVDEQCISLIVVRHNEEAYGLLAEKVKTRTPVKGKVVEVLDREAVVDIGAGIKALLPIKQVCDEFINLVSERLAVGDEVEALLTLVKGHDVLISIKQLERMRTGEAQDGDAPAKENRVVGVQVMEIKENWVVFDTGLESTNRLLVDEFLDAHGNLYVKPGDRVNVIVESLKKSGMITHISHRDYRCRQAWKQVVAAAESNTTIQGMICDRRESGYSVYIDGLWAFLPALLADLNPQKRDDPALIGKTESFFIESRVPETMTAELNRRKVQERNLFSGDFKLLAFGPGDRMQGRVAMLIEPPDNVAYVNLGDGILGRLHRDDLSWHRVGNISEQLEIDQELEVVVLEFNHEENYIKLGVKQLTQDPWIELEKTYPAGSRIFGTVTLVKDYGAFVEIEKGIEGLVHTSEMDWQHRNVNANNYAKVGDSIEVMMLELDKDKRRISLSVKQCQPNPWEELKVTYRPGSKLRGKVIKRSEDLGLIVKLPGGVNGLVHKSNLTYGSSWRDVYDKYQINDFIEVILIKVNVENERVSLGIKQCQPRSWEEFKVMCRPGSKLRGKVINRSEDLGLFVKLPGGVTGLVHKSDLTYGSSWRDVYDKYQINDFIEVILIKVNVENERVSLGIKQLTQDPWIELEKTCPAGSRIFGTVTRVEEYGALVEIEKGIEGLVHTSEMDWQHRNVNANNYAKVGDSIEVMMLELNKNKRRILLSIKQCQPNPWEEFKVTYRPGSKLRGKVSSRSEDLGLFVKLPGGVIGLVHKSNLTYGSSWRDVYEKYQINDFIEVILIKVDVENERVSLGIKQLTQDPWIELEKTYPAGSRIIGTVTRVEDYGAFVEIEKGIEGLVHTSEMDWQHRYVNANNYAKVGDSIEVMMLELDKDKRRIWLSIKQCQPRSWEEFKVMCRPGSKLRGKVSSRSEDLGLFVKLPGGVTGLVHKSDLTYGSSWRDVYDKYQINDFIEVILIKVNVENERVSLGIKQLTQDPWIELEKTYPAGSRIIGTVTGVEDYGAFVEIEKGIEGLVHTSEMDWQHRNVNANNYAKVGDSIEVMMLDLNKDKRRISLSIKQCQPRSWEEFKVMCRPGSKLRGKVIKRSEDLGLFVKLPGGVTGLVHKSNLTYGSSWRDVYDKYQINDFIEVILIEVNVENKRVSLGIKQLGANPYEIYEDKARSRQPVTGKVSKIKEKSAIVDLGEGIEAILPIGEISEERINSVEEKVKLGEEIEALVARVEKRTVVLSIKALALAKERDELRRQASEESGASRAKSFGAVVSQTLGIDTTSKDEAKDDAAEPAADAAGSEEKGDDTVTNDKD